MPAKFEYIKGGAIAEIPWFPADPLLLNNWKAEAIDLIENSSYDFWVCGGALEKWFSWDVDVVLTGELQDLAELKDLLDNITQLGFNHRQLVDLYWCDDYRKPFESGPCKHLQLACDAYAETGRCTLEECLIQKSIEVILPTAAIIKNGRQVWSAPANSIDVGHSLCKYQARSPSVKQIKRIESGTIYKGTPRRITRDLDFRDIIYWSHQ